MPVLGPRSLALEVPSLDEGIRFYESAGLRVEKTNDAAAFFCQNQLHESITLVCGVEKRLHHIALRADGLDVIADLANSHGGTIIPGPPGFDPNGLWITDPHGMRIHLVEDPAEDVQAPPKVFEINAPNRLVRRGRSAMRPRRTHSGPTPLRLGHILVFTPDVMRSVDFMTGALGMGLADYAQDTIAFCCARVNSEHHVVAFAKSEGIGFHHASFQLSDPDEVGRAGRDLAEKAGRGDWGFGRHTIGSNFFHYIQDPWGSWFEYYSDMDYIDDHARWNPTNYDLQDSLANWGPPVPKDFVRNYEVFGR